MSVLLETAVMDFEEVARKKLGLARAERDLRQSVRVLTDADMAEYVKQTNAIANEYQVRIAKMEEGK